MLRLLLQRDCNYMSVFNNEYTYMLKRYQMEIMKIHWIRQNNEPLTLAERSNEIKKKLSGYWTGDGKNNFFSVKQEFKRAVNDFRFVTLFTDYLIF